MRMGLDSVSGGGWKLEAAIKIDPRRQRSIKHSPVSGGIYRRKGIYFCDRKEARE